jgi:hypothetical protein
MPTGNIWAIGNIRDVALIKGEIDLLVTQLDLNGNTLTIETIGSTVEDQPGATVYLASSNSLLVLGMSKSLIYKSQGDFDFWAFLLDYKGRNQCFNLFINDVSTKLVYDSSSISFKTISSTSFVDLSTTAFTALMTTNADSKFGTIFTTATLPNFEKTFCTNLYPIVGEEAISD